MDQSLVQTIAQEFGISTSTVNDAVAFVFGKPRGDDASWSPEPYQFDELRGYIYNVYASAASPAITQSSSIGTFKSLYVSRWRQFDSIELDLTAQLTVLTGENGTGKTTLLALLGQALNESTEFVGTPDRDEEGFFFKHGRDRSRADGRLDIFGSIELSTGENAHIGVRHWSTPDQPAFTPELLPTRQIPGIYLDAQRVIGPYQRVESIPARFNSATEIAQIYKQQLKNLFIPHSMIKSPSLLIKEALIAAALYGEGSAVVTKDPRASEVWTGFQRILARLFPQSLGFRGFKIDQGELILQSKSGDFALEASSGGVAAIVSIAWQIYLSSVEIDGSFTVCFDEPENHLHPALQKTILPSLMTAFPKIRFIVATHSPFVVTSARDAMVYSLRRNQAGTVFAQRSNLDDDAYSAEEILTDVLGVPSTMPAWADDRLRFLLDELKTEGISKAAVVDLLEKLNREGIRLSVPEVSRSVTAAISKDSSGLTS